MRTRLCRGHPWRLPHVRDSEPEACAWPSRWSRATPATGGAAGSETVEVPLPDGWQSNDRRHTRLGAGNRAQGGHHDRSPVRSTEASRRARSWSRPRSPATRWTSSASRPGWSHGGRQGDLECRWCALMRWLVLGLAVLTVGWIPKDDEPAAESTPRLTVSAAASLTDALTACSRRLRGRRRAALVRRLRRARGADPPGRASPTSTPPPTRGCRRSWPRKGCSGRRSSSPPTSWSWRCRATSATSSGSRTSPSRACGS